MSEIDTAYLKQVAWNATSDADYYSWVNLYAEEICNEVDDLRGL